MRAGNRNGAREERTPGGYSTGEPRGDSLLDLSTSLDTTAPLAVERTDVEAELACL